MAPAAAPQGCWRWTARAGRASARQTLAGESRTLGLGWPKGWEQGHERRPRRALRPRHRPDAAPKRTRRVGGKTRPDGSRPRWGWQRGLRRGHSWGEDHATPAATDSPRKDPHGSVAQWNARRARRAHNTASTTHTPVRTSRLREPSLRRGPLGTRTVARPWRPTKLPNKEIEQNPCSCEARSSCCPTSFPRLPPPLLRHPPKQEQKPPLATPGAHAQLTERKDRKASPPDGPHHGRTRRRGGPRPDGGALTSAPAPAPDPAGGGAVGGRRGRRAPFIRAAAAEMIAATDAEGGRGGEGGGDDTREEAGRGAGGKSGEGGRRGAVRW